MKTIEIHDTHVLIYYDGPNDVNTLTSLMEEVSEICKKGNIKKLLIDLSNMTGEPKFIDRFKLGVAAVRILRALSKVAVVYKNVETNRFAEIVASNRGLPSYITHDINEAKRWLEVE